MKRAYLVLGIMAVVNCTWAAAPEFAKFDDVESVFKEQMNEIYGGHGPAIQMAYYVCEYFSAKPDRKLADFHALNRGDTKLLEGNYASQSFTFADGQIYCAERSYSKLTDDDAPTLKCVGEYLKSERWYKERFPAVVAELTKGSPLLRKSVEENPQYKAINTSWELGGKGARFVHQFNVYNLSAFEGWARDDILKRIVAVDLDPAHYHYIIPASTDMCHIPALNDESFKKEFK